MYTCSYEHNFLLIHSCKIREDRSQEGEHEHCHGIRKHGSLPPDNITGSHPYGPEPCNKVVRAMILPLLLLLLLHGESHITDAGTEDSRGLLALTDSFPSPQEGHPSTTNSRVSSPLAACAPEPERLSILP